LRDNLKNVVQDHLALLRNIEPDQLKAFVADYLSRDLKFKALFNKEFKSAPGAENKGSDSPAISSKPKGFDLQSPARPAFDAAKSLYESLISLSAQDAWLCLDVIDNISDLANTRDDRVYIYDSCLELLENKPIADFDCETKFLGICANLLARENLSGGQAALSMHESKPLGEKFLKLLFERTEALEAQAKSADQLHFISAKYEIARSLQDKDISEDMCLKALAFGVDTQKWLLRLYGLYQEKGSDLQMAPVAESILFNGRPDFYGKLKSHLQILGIWEKERSDLIDRCAQLPQYLEILENEQAWDKLMLQVRKRPDLIYQYGAMLSDHNRLLVKTIFNTTILDEAYNSTKQENYASVCQHLEAFHDAGFATEAIELARNTRETFRRKSPFVDELTKFVNKVSK
jgi:hypothetical protein